VTGVFDPLNQGNKGPAPPLEQKSDDRYTSTCTYRVAQYVSNFYVCNKMVFVNSFKIIFAVAVEKLYCAVHTRYFGFGGHLKV